MDPAVHDLPPSSKKCGAGVGPHGTTPSLEFHRRHSYPACVFECQLRRARRNCSGTPWEYPAPDGDDGTVLPQHLARRCFEPRMEEPPTHRDCPGCAADCDGTEYAYRVRERSVDVEEWCKKNENR